MDFNLLPWRNVLLSLAGDGIVEAHRSTATPTMASVFGDEQPAKINDEVYALYIPAARPTLEVVFFHGLELGDYQDSYWRNWLCADESQCWPKAWLAGDRPDARVLSVAYDSSLTKTSTTGRLDLYKITENMKFSLIYDAGVGQNGCPVIFVGHSLGGVVMKALCARAKQGYPARKKRQRGDLMETFVDNLKGLFFLATPHDGSIFSDAARSSLAGPLMDELKVLDSHSARLNQDFGQFLDHHPSIKLWGVAESQPTRLGKFFDVVVSEGSARFLKYSEYYTASADHFGVCKPESKTSSTYKFLTRFLHEVVNEADYSGVDCFQDLPPQVGGPDARFGNIEELAEGNSRAAIDEMRGIEGRTAGRETVPQGPPSFPFKLDVRYVRLRKTEESVMTALRDSRGSTIVLLHGGPGTGKSAMARSLALHFQNERAEETQQRASTSGLMFDRVLYMDCGPNVTLVTKQRELLDQLDMSKYAGIAGVKKKRRLNTLAVKQLLFGLLNERPTLIVLDDVWKFEGKSSAFLQGMVDVGGESVKWLVTSQFEHLCEHLNICSSPIGIEDVQRDDARRILAALTGLEEPAIRKLQAVMDRIIDKTGANPLAMTCVASAMTRKRCQQEEEWKRLARDLSAILNSPAAIQMHGISHGRSYWGAIRLGFKHLSRAQKNLLILIHMCKGPSVSSGVIEYLFQQTQHQNCSEAFSQARDALQERQLLTIKIMSDPGLGDEESWSIHDLLREFINREVFGDFVNRVPIVDTLAKEGIMFEKGTTSKLEHEVVMGVASFYFDNNFSVEFSEKMALSSWTPELAGLIRKVIDPIAHLLGLTEDEQWTSALHSCISQVFLTFMKYRVFDLVPISSLLNSPISIIPTLCSLYRSKIYFNINHRFAGQQIICTLSRLLESQITFVIEASSADLFSRDLTRLTWISWGLSEALSNSLYENIAPDFNSTGFQTIIERLIFGLDRVDSHSSTCLPEVLHNSDYPSDSVRECFVAALANLPRGYLYIAEKMIDFPAFFGSLVKAMTTKDSPALQAEAARCILNLASRPEVTEIMGLKIVNYPGVLEALVDGLDTSKTKCLQWNSAGALTNLAGIPGDQIKSKIIMFEGALRNLIFALLDADDHEMMEASVGALATLAYGGGGIAEKMIDFPELLGSLVKAMRTKDSADLQTEAVRCIRNLASRPEATETMGLKIVGYLGVLEALVDGLDTSKPQLFQWFSACALSNLARIPGNQIKWKIVMFEGALRNLILALLDVDDRKGNEDRAIALANLACGNGGIAKKMIDFPGLLESLVKAMRTKDSPGLQTQAVHCIRNLASQCEATQIMGLKIVSFPGVLDALVDGLDTSKIQLLQWSSAAALANLARIPGNEIKWKIVRFEGAMRNLKLALGDVDDRKVNEQSARALANLTYEDDGIVEMIDFPGILESLVKAMSTKDSPGLQTQAIRCISNLASQPEATEIMGLNIVSFPGVLDALVDGLDTSKNQRLRWNSAVALANLAGILGNQIKWKIVRFEGALRNLILGLGDVDDHQVNEQSVGALASLACGDGGIVEKLIDFPGLLESLVKAMRTKDSPGVQAEAVSCIINLASQPEATEIMGLKIVNCPGVLDALVDGLHTSKNQLFEQNKASALAYLAGIPGDQIKWKIIRFEGALRNLILALLDVHDREGNEDCAIALANLAYGDGGIVEKMIDFPGLLESLVKAMTTKDSPGLQAQAVSCIINLASQPEATEIMGLRIVDFPGVLDALVDGLDTSNNQQFQRNSASTLANLAGIPGDQIKWKIMRFEGALRNLILALGDVDDGEVNEQSARALANLAYEDGGIVEMIDFPGLLESLVKAMRTKDSPGLQTQAVRCIRNLASQPEATEIMGLKIVSFPGFCDALVDGLDTSKNQRLQRNSAWALSNLARIPGNEVKWKIVRFERALRSLILALLDVDDREGNEDCAIALTNLAYGDGGIAEKMIHFPGLLESLVKAMRMKDSPGLQTQAVCCVRNLASQPEATEIMGLKIVSFPGVLDALVDGLDTSKNQRFQWNSAGALANLAGIPGNEIKWKIIRFEGALRNLILALRGVDDREGNEDCTIALTNLAIVLTNLACGDGGIVEKMIDFPELLESLVKAMRTKASPGLQAEAIGCIINLTSQSEAMKIMGLKIVDCPGVLDALVDGLYTSKNQQLQCNSASALANLAGIPGDQIKRKIIKFEGALRNLILTLLDVDDHEVKKQSARALANLAYEDGGIVEMIDFPGLLESLVKAMRTKDSPGLQAQAVSCIINLASQSKATEIMGLKIVDCPGVLDALVSGLHTSKNQEFQQNSACALAYLARIPGDQIKWKIIRFEGALRNLIFALLDADDHEMMEESVKALATLAYGGGGIAEKMIDFPELFGSLVKAMRTKDSADLQTEAVRCIVNLASGPEATETMGLKIVGYPGVLEALVDGLDTFKPQRLQQNSAYALASLAEIPGDRIKWKIMRFKGALSKLIFAMLNVDDNDVKKHWAHAIRTLAEGDNEIRMKMKEDCPEILAVLENAVARDETSESGICEGMLALTLLDPLRAKVIHVDSAAVYLGRGGGELLLGLYKDALEDLDRYEAICTLEQNPNAREVFSWRCCAKAKLGDLQGALADADSLVSLECTEFALQERGVVKRMLGDLPDALADLNASLHLSDDDYEVLKHRGFVHFLMNDEKSARADAERAVRCKPSHVDNVDYGCRCLGASSVQYLDFELR